MTITLYEHPLSPYAQKNKIALYEKNVPFELKMPTGIGSGTYNPEFVAGASPLTAQRTGDTDFCAVTDGALRSNPTAGGPPPSTVASCAAFAVVR